MSNNLENEFICKKDLIDWLREIASAYKDLQYLYRDRIVYGKEMTILCAVADYVRCMKPYDSNEMKEE